MQTTFHKNVSILTDEERILLPLVLKRRETAQQIVRTSIKKHRDIFSNCLLIQGKPGTGKTSLVINHLSRMKKAGEIADYRRIAGHVTPTQLFNELRQASKTDENDAPHVLVLDDVDCLADDKCLELMKAAFDTKVNIPTNRVVYGKMMTVKTGNVKSSVQEDTTFKFDGFGIIITNEDISKGKPTINQEALLDRVQSFNIDLGKQDMAIYNAHIIEKYLDENEDGLTEAEIDRAVECFNVDIRRWLKADAFRNSGINFSIRVIKKFIDSARMFCDDWKQYNSDFIKLEKATEAFEERQKVEQFNSQAPVAERKTVVVEHRPADDDFPVIINPRTGKPYSKSHTYKLLREGYAV